MNLSPPVAPQRASEKFVLQTSFLSRGETEKLYQTLVTELARAESRHLAAPDALARLLRRISSLTGAALSRRQALSLVEQVALDVVESRRAAGRSAD